MALPSEKPEVIEDNNCPHRHFIKVPLCYQETEYTCGVACVQSILAGYGINYRQDVLAEILMTKPIFGTDYENMISFLHRLGFRAELHTGMTLSDLRAYIKDGITPILIIQAWKEDDIDYCQVWRDTHYAIACGFEDDRILFMDPYTLGNYTYIPDNELIKRWHNPGSDGDRNYNSAILVTNDNLSFTYNPHFIKHQD